MYCQRRGPHFVRQDLDILPGYLAAPASFQGFQKSLFGGKPPGVRLRGRDTFAIAKSPLIRRENPFGKPRSSGDRLAYAIDFRYVDADG